MFGIRSKIIPYECKVKFREFEIKLSFERGGGGGMVRSILYLDRIWNGNPTKGDAI